MRSPTNEQVFPLQDNIVRRAIKSVKIITLLLIFIQPESVYANDSLPIGTVIYSAIKPEVFLKNNPAWMLADGCDSLISKKIYGDAKGAEKKFQASILHTMIEMLPDARGIFLRGMNLDRPSTFGDADGNRDVGIYQKDAFETHQHKYLDVSVSAIVSDDADDRGVGSPPSNATRTTDPAGNSSETRPRNIALYIYIKVN